MSIHQKLLRILATELFKSLAEINPDFMKSYFTIKKYPGASEMEILLKTPSSPSTLTSARHKTNSILFRACLYGIRFFC